MHLTADHPALGEVVFPKAPVIEKPTGSGKFKRIEDKVLLSRTQTDSLLEDVNRHMKPSYLHEGTNFTLIASYYFDSAELGFFHHHFLKTPKRYKLRLRRYAPNGVWSSEPPLLELKSKESGISRKRRFSLTPGNHARLIAGKTILLTDELCALNSDIAREKLFSWVTKINGLLLEFGLKPTLRVKYKRLAFEAADGFRLTIDRDLEIETLDPKISEAAATPAISGEVWEKAGLLAARYEREQHCVVELKHTGVLPPWLTSFLKRNEVEETSFSKYCWAVHEAARPESPLPAAGNWNERQAQAAVCL